MPEQQIAKIGTADPEGMRGLCLRLVRGDEPAQRLARVCRGALSHETDDGAKARACQARITVMRKFYGCGETDALIAGSQRAEVAPDPLDPEHE